MTVSLTPPTANAEQVEPVDQSTNGGWAREVKAKLEAMLDQGEAVG